MLHNRKLVGIASFRIANSFRNGIIYSFLAIYLREQLTLSVTYSNLLYTLIELFGALSQFLVWGFILDRYKRKNVLIVMGETVPALGYIGIYFLHKSLLTSSGTYLAGLSLVLGIPALEFFWGAGFVGFYALLSDIPNSVDRSKYLGWTITLSSIGTIGGTLIGGLLYNWKAPGGGFGHGILFFILTPIILGFAALAWGTRKYTEERYQTPDKAPKIVSEELHIETKTPTIAKQAKERANLRLFYWFLAGIVVSSLGRGAVAQVTIFYLRLPASISITAGWVSIISILRWVGHLISGPLASKLSVRYAKIGYMGTLIWFMFLPILYPFVTSVSMAAALFISNGLAMGINSVTSFAIVSPLITPEKRGRLFGQYNASQMVAWGAGGSLIGGPLADWRISQGASLAASYSFTFVASLLMGAAAIGLTLWKARKALSQSAIIE